MSTITARDIFQTFPERFKPEAAEGISGTIGYRLTGDGGGEWSISVSDGQCSLREGLHEPTVTMTVATQDFIDMMIGKLAAATAFGAGKIGIEGDMSLLLLSGKLFDKYNPPASALSSEPQPEEEELIRKRLTISLPQKFSTGPIMGRFLRELRDNKRIMAIKDPATGHHLLPPREVCAKSHQPCHEWEEVGPNGTIAEVDFAYYASPDPLSGETRATPYTIVYVKLDGTKGPDTLWHELKETDPAVVRKGRRVRPVWNSERTGSMRDILHFEIIPDSAE